MYSSLDRVDIVLKPGPDGRQPFVQTDHRTNSEIERERDLSIVFALIRILNPKRMREEGSPEPIVMYMCQERPPEFLAQAINAAGGVLVIGPNLEQQIKPEQPLPLEGIIESAFSGLARAVAAEYGVPQTVEGLEMLEPKLAASAGDPETDETAYWSAAVKLGCFGGELIRTSNVGEWLAVASGSLPFALSVGFRGESATVNPLGKAIKRFANGEEDSMVTLVQLIQREP